MVMNNLNEPHKPLESGVYKFLAKSNSPSESSDLRRRISKMRLCFFVIIVVLEIISGVLSKGCSEGSLKRLKVCIPDGCLQGVTKKGNKKPYDAFYGIPFATPPIGLLRFKVRSISTFISFSFKITNYNLHRTRYHHSNGIIYGTLLSLEIPVCNRIISTKKFRGVKIVFI